MIERLAYTDSFCSSKTSGNLTNKQLCAIITTVALMMIACITVGSLASAGYFSVGGAPGEIGFFSTAGVLLIADLIFTIYKCTHSNGSQPTVSPEEIDKEALDALAAAQKAEEEALGALAAAQKAQEEALGALAAAQKAEEEALGALAAAKNAQNVLLQQLDDVKCTETKSLSEAARIGDIEENERINGIMITYYEQKLEYAKTASSTLDAVSNAINAMQNTSNATEFIALKKLFVENAVEDLSEILEIEPRPTALDSDLAQLIQRTINVAKQIQHATLQEAQQIQQCINTSIKNIEGYRAEYQKKEEAAFSDYLTQKTSLVTAEAAIWKRDTLLERATELDAEIQDQERIYQQFCSKVVEQEAAVKTAILFSIAQQEALRLATNFRMEKEKAVKKKPKD